MNWKPSRRTEQLYAQELIRFFERLLQRSEAEGIPIEMLGAADFISNYAKQVATRMVTALYFAGARTWREAAQKSGRGLMIRRALQNELKGPVGVRVRELIEENAELISSLPESVALAVSRQAAEKQFAGGRPSELVPSLLRHIGRTRAKLIARTEVSKASAALTQMRSESLNLSHYAWETADDERVRRSHRKMQGVLVPFADPPSPELLVGEKSEGHYNAGQIYNCRCYIAPLVRFEQVTWPHRVYASGRIRSMTLAQFRQLNQFQEAA